MDDKAQHIVFAITFASFTLILLSFFIFLDSIAERDSKKAQLVVQSLQPYFSPVRAKHLPEAPRRPGHQAASELNAPRLSLEILAETAKAAGLAVESAQEGLLLTSPAAAAFYPRDAQLRSEILSVLSYAAELSRVQNMTISAVLTGDLSPSGSRLFRSRFELAAARAGAVYRFFLDTGANPQKITAHGLLPGTGRHKTQGEESERLLIRLSRGVETGGPGAVMLRQVY